MRQEEQRKFTTYIGKHIIIEADVRLQQKDEWKVLSICWCVWRSPDNQNVIKLDRYCECCGQCYDEIKELIPLIEDKQEKKTWNFIIDMWEKYHLNDMHAWTLKQEKFLKELHSDGSRYDYTKDCEALAGAGILVCNGYKYWTAWLFRKIPFVDLNKIIHFIRQDLYYNPY